MMRRFELSNGAMRGTAATLLTLLLALGGCDDPPADPDAGPGTDSGTGMTDAGGDDTDAGGDMDAGDDVDAGGDDAGTTDGGMTDAGMDAGPVGGGAATSAQIAMVHAAEDGALDPALPIDGAIVTYVKPALGDDAAGFFVQAEPMGPALFVMVDPASLTPAAEVGQVVTFSVTERATESPAGTDGGTVRASMITGWTVDSSGHDVSFLAQDLGATPDLVSALDGYESELFSGTFTIAEGFSGAGAGHLAAVIETAVITGESNLRFRIPETVAETLHASVGCQLTVTNVPMWRYFAAAQLSAYDAADVVVDSCSAPTVTGAGAASDVSVVVTFSSELDPASVMADGSQFTIAATGGGALTVIAATASGNTVTLTTAAQTAGTEYTVTVASTVLDFHGQGVDATMNTATFTAPTPHLVINEIDYDQDGTEDHEFIEIHNPFSSPISLADVQVILINGNGLASYGMAMLSDPAAPTSLGAGEYLVVTSGNSGSVMIPAGVATVALDAGSIQNGDDGVLLINSATGEYHDSIYYEDPPPSVTVGAMTYMLEGDIGTDVVRVEMVGGVEMEIHQSLSRSPNGADTDTGADFAVRPSSPGLPTAPPIP